MFVLRPMLKSIMSGAPAISPVEARIPAGAAAGEYARQAAEAALRQGGAERSMTETEMTREMARADAKQFADILRNWIK